MEIHLNFSDTNNTATNTSTSITSGLAQFMATFAQIIGIGMYNNGTTQNAVGTEQTNLFVGNFNLFKDKNVNYTKIKYFSYVTLVGPSPLASMLPKSPTCLFSSLGAPCSLPQGLKWGPADVQPLVLSPNS